MALELLWTEAPDAVEVQELAGQLGLQEPRFRPRAEAGKCILCGLCVRACREILGQSAIGFADRGADRNVDAPLGESSDTCIGCRACVAICPTGHVRSVDDGPLRRIDTWNTDLELAKCGVCDRPFAAVKELEFIRAKLPEHVAGKTVCPSCRRKQTVERLAGVSDLLQRSGAS